MSTQIFGSIITAMVTPMHADGSVDLDGAARLAHWLTTDGGSDGLVVNGTTGEAATTSDQEKAAVLTAVREAVDPAVRVIAGVGSSATAHSIELATTAASRGADALLVAAPYYVRPTQAGLVQHFRDVADSTPLPVMVYDIPKRTGVAIEPETFAALAEHERILAVKDAKGDLESSSWVIRDTGLAYYSGDDALNLPLLSIGAVGFVSVASHVAGPELRQLLSDHSKGDVQAAAALHRQLLPIYRGMFRCPGAASAKAAVAELDQPAGPVRPPLMPLTDDERDALRQSMSAANLTLIGGH